MFEVLESSKGVFQRVVVAGAVATSNEADPAGGVLRLGLSRRLFIVVLDHDYYDNFWSICGPHTIRSHFGHVQSAKLTSGS